MTLIKFNQIAQASGKINGTIYARNASGQYMKSLQRPINPSTMLQSTQRQLLSILTKRWSIITQLQRDGWNDLATTLVKYNRVSNLISRSGFNVYIEFNSNYRMIGETAYLDDAPTPPAFSYECQSFLFRKSTSTNHVWLFASLGEALVNWEDFSFVFSTTGIISLGKIYFKGTTKILDCIPCEEDEYGVAFDCTNYITSKYGRLPIPTVSMIATVQVILKSFPISTVKQTAFLDYTMA